MCISQNNHITSALHSFSVPLPKQVPYTTPLPKKVLFINVSTLYPAKKPLFRLYFKAKRSDSEARSRENCLTSPCLLSSSLMPFKDWVCVPCASLSAAPLGSRQLWCRLLLGRSFCHREVSRIRLSDRLRAASFRRNSEQKVMKNSILKI